MQNNKKYVELLWHSKYDKIARPFELWNVGNYETIYWQEKEEEYLSLMLELYQVRPLNGFRYLHGAKGDRIVHVDPLNAPVTMEEVEKVGNKQANVILPPFPFMYTKVDKYRNYGA